MELYIQSAAAISPQPSFDAGPLSWVPMESVCDRLAALEPDYRLFIDLKQIRRMSRVIKMGVAAAMKCLQAAGVEKPDAIVTGTAYGCLEDTGTFLSKMVAQQEAMLAPTAFIQSTHNTVGAQIALMLDCKGYNNVFVHGAFSFENALLDAMMLVQEQEAQTVLVGGVDEITDASHAILSRFRLYRRQPVSNLRLFEQREDGTIAGEGAAFFLLGASANSNAYAKIAGVSTLYKPSGVTAIERHLDAFLAGLSLAREQVDLVVTGKNGDSAGDQVYDEVLKAAGIEAPAVNYKHLCGEYPTSVSFGLWLAAGIIRDGAMPSWLALGDNLSTGVRSVLLFNHHQRTHYSFILVKAC